METYRENVIYIKFKNIQKKMTGSYYYREIQTFFWGGGFCLFLRVAPLAYGGSQAWGLIGATAAGLGHSHSNVGFEPCLPPIPQLTETPDP